MKITKWLFPFCLLFLSQPAAAAEKVAVVTSYPQETLTQFEAAFEKRYPQYKLEIVWRQSRDAMAYLDQPHAPVDVYWAPAQRNFTALAQRGAFRKLEIDRSGLPEKIGGFRISDEDGYYVATEVAGYGMVYHPAELQRLGLPAPADWKDLAAPGYQGRVVLPIPSKVGFAPVLIDTLVLSYGWQPGWEVLTQIAANAVLGGSGSTFITDDVGSGRMLAGITIDFFAVSAIANGKPLRFAYPERVGYSPAHIAVFKEAGNPAGARAFAEFVLSTAGQKLLFHPDIRKLPVRPETYAAKPEDYFDPFASAARASYDYDIASGLLRQDVVGALFDALITRPHEQLKAMHQALRLAAQKSPDDARLAEARRHAHWLPITLAQADDAALQQIFAQRDGEQRAALEKQWDAAIARHYAEATRIALKVAAEKP